MKINKEKEKELKVASGAVNAARMGIQSAKRNLNTLNMGNVPEEPEEGAEDPTEIDPTMFMSSKEELMWNRLSEQKKEYYIKKGMEAAERSPEAQSQASGVLFQESLQEEAQAEQSFNFYQFEHAKESEIHKNREGVFQEEAHGNIGESAGEYQKFSGESWGKPIPEEIEKHGQSVSENVPYWMPENNGIPITGGMSESGGYAAAGETAEKIGTGMTSSASSFTAKTVEAGASGTGVGIAAAVGQKTAEIFKQAVETQAMAANYSAPQEADGLQSGNPLPKSPIVTGGAAMLATLVSFAGTLIQTTTSLLISLFSSLITVVVPIVSVVSLAGVLAASIISLVTNPGSGNGSEQIVQVALDEAGTTDGSKYWEFVMGSEFVDGNTTPWCACFVSWCANECGYIEEGLFPKSASVATYRSFFSSRNLYQEADGYKPKQGDLIIFGNDEHIGIVQYTDAERVITIEGNTSDIVHARRYALTSTYITGYCTPQYPQEADFSGDTNAEIAYHYFRSMGCTPEAAVGILGNLKVESGPSEIDPNRYQDNGGPGRGICQWEVGGGRFEALAARAEAEGKQWNDLEVQLEFLWYELNGGEATCTYIMNRDYGGIENFKNATDIAWAVEAFEYSFERAGVPAIEERITYAQEFYAQFAE